MSSAHFETESGVEVPAVTAREMREIDRIAVDEFGLGILQMMENAGRTLALNAIEMIESSSGSVVVLAGSGGNGGGGLCCARHLHNRGFAVRIVLDRPVELLRGVAAHQMRILAAAGLQPVDANSAEEAIRRADLVVDALIGYGLHEAPRGEAARLIRLSHSASRVLSLDVPSGLNATTGAGPGDRVRPERTLTLALPKTGLASLEGDLYLADIGIPPEVYERIGRWFVWPEANRHWIRLESR